MTDASIGGLEDCDDVVLALFSLEKGEERFVAGRRAVDKRGHDLDVSVEDSPSES